MQTKWHTYVEVLEFPDVALQTRRFGRYRMKTVSKMSVWRRHKRTGSGRKTGSPRCKNESSKRTGSGRRCCSGCGRDWYRVVTVTWIEPSACNHLWCWVRQCRRRW